MVHTKAEAHLALSKAVQQANEALSRQKSFVSAIEAFQQNLLRDLQISNSESQSYFSKAAQNMEAAIQGVLTMLANAINSIESDFNSLDKVSPMTDLPPEMT